MTSADPAHENAGYPAWVQEFDLSLPITAQYVISGNVHDVHGLAITGTALSTVDLLRERLVSNDYDLVYRFDSLEGIWLEYVRDGMSSNSFFPDSHLNRATVGSVAKLADLLLRSASETVHRVALIVNSASAIWGDSDNVEASRLQLASRRLASTSVSRVPGGARSVAPGNAIIWIADAESDAPDWLRHSDSTRSLRVPLPSLGVRRAAAANLLREVPDLSVSTPSAAAAAVDTFAETAQGLTLRAMRSVLDLALDQGITPDRMDEAVRSFRAGVADSPWQDAHLLTRIRNGEEAIERRVLGQPRAVRRALDILLRSALGLTGAHHGGSRTRPQGILFFAGPTGVGKTELAKSLAEVLFGAEDAYTRFDMSEFSAEHSEARLIGAPPGYVGHRDGGELTNAVREKPFSVLLFDEIEKAHPRILDKFLQILDDGRLTDGSGETVYFSETVVIFTSNLGAGAALTEKSVDPQPSAAEDATTAVVLGAIRRHFIEVLERPELLSRMGDNIIVFDPIGPDVAAALTKKYIDTVVDTVKVRRDVTLVVNHRARAAVQDYAMSKLAFGGRGVATAVETALVNPLARIVAGLATGGTAHVQDAQETADGWILHVELGRRK